MGGCKRAKGEILRQRRRGIRRAIKGPRRMTLAAVRRGGDSLSALLDACTCLSLLRGSSPKDSRLAKGITAMGANSWSTVPHRDANRESWLSCEISSSLLGAPFSGGMAGGGAFTAAPAGRVSLSFGDLLVAGAAEWIVGVVPSWVELPQPMAKPLHPPRKGGRPAVGQSCQSTRKLSMMFVTAEHRWRPRSVDRGWLVGWWLTAAARYGTSGFSFL